jgi:hypothetical protein
MLDLYKIDDGISEYFDAMPDFRTDTKRGHDVHGGVRERLASQDEPRSDSPLLTKYPLTYYDKNVCYIDPHYPWPSSRNSNVIFARLLHRKLTAWSSDRLDQTIAENQHYNQSVEYKNYRRWIDRSLHHESSRTYTGPADIVDCGLMEG